MVTTNTLTKSFKDFALCLHNSELTCDDYSMDRHIKARIVFSRLYYACFHKALENYPSIRDSRQGQKHKRLIESLKRSDNPEDIAILPLIEKLQDLRVWADYEYNNTLYESAGVTAIGYIIYQINLQL